MDADLRSIQRARDLAVRARLAAQEWAGASQKEVDRVVDVVAKAGRGAADRLSELAVRVTGYGRADHKRIKDLFNTTEVHQAIAPLTTVGVISASPTGGVVEIAEPVGVVAALIPTTNPVSTVFFKALVAIKARNAVVMSPHPRAAAASQAAVEVVSEAVRSAGAPGDLVAALTEVTLAGTTELMHHPDVAMLLATGSAQMVRTAYSSGKPTYAVGPGNVPAYLNVSVPDLDEAVAAIVASAVFDYGTPCASEQALIVDQAIDRAVRERLERHGARFLTDAEAEALTRAVFTPSLTFDPDCVGQSPQALAARAGLSVDPATSVLVVQPRGVGRAHPLSMEILTSTLKYYVVPGAREGIEQANEILRFGGEGHTAAVWAGDERVAGVYGAAVRAFRVLVNTPSCFGAMGATAALPPSFMLGTGSWGGGITADNIGPLHLINRKRIARGMRDWRDVVTSATPVTTPVADPVAVAEDLVRRVLARLPPLDRRTGS